MLSHGLKVTLLQTTFIPITVFFIIGAGSGVGPKSSWQQTLIFLDVSNFKLC